MKTDALMLRIVAPHFVAGIVRGGEAAPIISYMKGWTRRQIEAYCARKGWAVEVISCPACGAGRAP